MSKKSKLKFPKMLKVGTIAVLLVGLPSAALALDLSFLRALTGPIAQITKIDEDFLNSGLNDIQAAQQLFRTGELDAKRLLGRLGLPDSTVGATRRITNPGDINTVFDDGYYRSRQVQDHVHRILGRKGQEAQGRELGQVEGFRTVATDILQTSEQLAQQSSIEAQQAEVEAQAANAASQAAQSCRSSQCVLKAYSRQLAYMGNQNSNMSEQFAGLTTNMSAQATQIGALANQQAITNTQMARQTSIQGYQLQSLDRIDGAITALNFSQLSQRERNAIANQSSTSLLVIPNLKESQE